MKHDKKIFENFKKNKITLNSPINEHLNTISNLYSKLDIHGVFHVGRTAVLAPILVNLRHYFKDKEVKKITKEDLKLIQIGLLFHDSGREGEEKDLWDLDSATNYYYYLTITLGIKKDRTKKFAEALANKDYKTKHNNNVYYKLKIKNNKVKWTYTKSNQRKNIISKIIHDCDCLEIARARDRFDGTYLDFYQDIVKKNSLALSIMGLLIAEEKELLKKHGDTRWLINYYPQKRNKIKTQIKSNYKDWQNLYLKIKKDIAESHFLKTLYNSGKLLSHQKLDLNTLLKKINSSNDQKTNELNQDLFDGKLIFRGVAEPTNIKRGKPHALIEIEKILRKQGNPVASVCLMWFGGHPFSNVNFIIRKENLKGIQKIYETDNDTTCGKKCHFKFEPSVDIKSKKKKLLEKLKLGGTKEKYKGRVFMPHNECILTIKHSDIKAICFANIYNFANFNWNNYNHDSITKLHAILLQQTWKNLTKKELPIYEFSYNGFKPFICNKRTIIDLYVTKVNDYLNEKTHEKLSYHLFSKSTEEIVRLSLYDDINLSPFDYSEIILKNKIKEKVNNIITNYKHKWNSAIKKELKNSENFFNEKLFPFINENKNYIKNQCSSQLKKYLQNNLSDILNIKYLRESYSNLYSIYNSAFKDFIFEEILNINKNRRALSLVKGMPKILVAYELAKIIGCQQVIQEIKLVLVKDFKENDFKKISLKIKEFLVDKNNLTGKSNVKSKENLPKIKKFLDHKNNLTGKSNVKSVKSNDNYHMLAVLCTYNVCFHRLNILDKYEETIRTTKNSLLNYFLLELFYEENIGQYSFNSNIKILKKYIESTSYKISTELIKTFLSKYLNNNTMKMQVFLRIVELLPYVKSEEELKPKIKKQINAKLLNLIESKNAQQINDLFGALYSLDGPIILGAEANNMIKIINKIAYYKRNINNHPNPKLLKTFGRNFFMYECFFTGLKFYIDSLAYISEKNLLSTSKITVQKKTFTFNDTEKNSINAFLKKYFKNLKNSEKHHNIESIRKALKFLHKNNLDIPHELVNLYKHKIISHTQSNLHPYRLSRHNKLYEKTSPFVEEESEQIIAKVRNLCKQYQKLLKKSYGKSIKKSKLKQITAILNCIKNKPTPNQSHYDILKSLRAHLENNKTALNILKVHNYGKFFRLIPRMLQTGFGTKCIRERCSFWDETYGKRILTKIKKIVASCATFTPNHPNKVKNNNFVAKFNSNRHHKGTAPPSSSPIQS